MLAADAEQPQEIEPESEQYLSPDPSRPSSPGFDPQRIERIEQLVASTEELLGRRYQLRGSGQQQPQQLTPAPLPFSRVRQQAASSTARTVPAVGAFATAARAAPSSSTHQTATTGTAAPMAALGRIPFVPLGGMLGMATPAGSSFDHHRWAGTVGGEYLLWKQPTLAELHKQARKMPASPPLQFEECHQIVVDQLLLGQDGAVVARRLADELAHYLEEAQQGHFPGAVVPPATLERLRIRHSTVKNLDALIAQELTELQDMADKAQQQGRLANPLGQPVHARPVSEALQQQLIRVGPGRYTASMACLAFFWLLMDLHFGYAGTQELAAFLQLEQAGSQGAMTIPAWQLHVEEHFRFVQHLTEVNTTTPCKVFLGGLNSDELRQRGYQYWDDHKRTVTLETLAEELAQHAAELQQRRLHERTLSVYGIEHTALPSSTQQPGLHPGGSSSPEALVQPPGDPAALHTYSRAHNDLQVLQLLARKVPQDPDRRVELLLAMKRGLKSPAAPTSYCKLPEHNLDSFVKPPAVPMQELNSCIAAMQMHTACLLSYVSSSCQKGGIFSFSAVGL